MLKEKKCPICGSIFVGRPNKIYCSAKCCKKASKEYERKRGEERKKPEAEKKKHKSKLESLNLEEINKKARAEGLSYGQYMAKYYWS